MKIIFTKHIEDKLQDIKHQKLGITKAKLREVINNPLAIDLEIDPHQSIGKLNENLSLSVIWKVENNTLKMITFYASSKGRYESKILRRR